MSCRATRNQFSAYIEAELSEADRRHVADHLETCADCARELEALKKTMTLLRWIPPVEASDDFATRVMVRVRAERTARARANPWERIVSWWERSRPSLPWDGFELPVPALAGAAALGLVAGVLLTLELVGLPVGVADAPRVPGELAAMQGDRTEVATSDVTDGVTADRQPFRSDLPYAYARPNPGMSRVVQGDYGAVPAGDASYGTRDGSLEYGRYGWNEHAFGGHQLEGPSPVTVVEYVLQRVQYQQRPAPAQGVQQLPVGLRVENGYVTF